MLIQTASPRRETPQRQIFADYVLGHEVASSRYARIFDAFEPGAGGAWAPVVVKRLRTEAAGDAEIAERFHRELQLTARVQHPSSARLLRSGTFHDVPYAAYASAPGVSLAVASRFHPRQKLPEQVVLAVGLTAAQVLATAHRSGVTHGHFDTAQITITRTGAILIGGFAPTGLRCRSHEIEANELLLAQAAGPGPAGDAFWLGVLLLRLVSPRNEPPRVTRKLSALIHALLSFQPAARPSLPAVEETLAELRDRNHPVSAAGDPTAQSLAELVAGVEQRCDSYTTIAPHPLPIRQSSRTA